MSRLLRFLVLYINSAGASERRLGHILQCGSAGVLVQRLGAIVVWWGFCYLYVNMNARFSLITNYDYAAYCEVSCSKMRASVKACSVALSPTTYSSPVFFTVKGCFWNTKTMTFDEL